jgi:hypothetical protein
MLMKNSLNKVSSQSLPRGQCYNLENIFAEKIGYFDPNYSHFGRKIITLFNKEKRQFFPQKNRIKSPKTYAHNIDPRSDNLKKLFTGNVEESLDLRRVEVHGDDVVGAGHGQHVGHQLRADGSP